MKEIEKKYLIKQEVWDKVENKPKPVSIIQGYIFNSTEICIRIRKEGKKAFITIKNNNGMIRDEFEYEIPKLDASELLNIFSNKKTINKKRFIFDNNLIVDVFEKNNKGLIIAEKELLDNELLDNVELPYWIDTKSEVTNPIYYNNNIINYPFKQFKNYYLKNLWKI